MKRLFTTPPPLLRLCLLGLLASVGSMTACGAGDHNPWYPSPGSDAPLPAACGHAREQRARVAGLMAEGKLARALRVMQFAEGACPPEAPTTWASHVTALAAVGRMAEAKTLSARMDHSDRATAEDRRIAAQALAEAEARDKALLSASSGVEDAGPLTPPYRFTADDDTRFEATWTKRERAAALFQAGAAASAKSDYPTAKRRFLSAWAASRPNPRALYEAGLAAESMGEKAEAQRLWDRAAFDGAEAARPELPIGAPVGAFDARLAWSPRGHLLALASEGQISVYDAALQLRRRIFAAEQVSSVAFSPDETELFAGLASGHIRRYHLVFDTVRRDLDAHGGPVLAMTMAPDGQRFATAGSDGTLRIWGGEKSGLQVIPLPPGAVVDMAFSQDGDVLAFGQEGRIGAVDTRSFASLGEMDLHGGALRALSFGSETGKSRPQILSVVTATEELQVDAARLKGAPRPRAPAHPKNPTEAASARPTVFAMASATEITVKDTASGKVVTTAPITPPSSLLRMALSPDGKTLAAAFLGHKLRLIPLIPGDRDTKSAKPVELGNASPLSSLSVSPDGRVFAAGAEDGSVELFRAAPPLGLQRLEGPKDAGGPARALVFSADGKLLAAGWESGAVVVWETEGLRVRSSYRAEAAVLSLGFSPDGARLAVGTEGPRIVMLSPVDGSVAGELRLNAGSVRALSFSPDGRALLTGSQEGVTLWDPPARKGERYVVYGTSPHDLAWSKEGSSFAVAGSDAVLSLGSPGSATAAKVIPVPAHVLSVAYSQQGALATAEADRSIVYRTSAGKQIQRFHEADAGVRRVVFTRDGLLLGAYEDGSLRLFRPPLGRAAAVLRTAGGSGGAAVGVAMTPGGHVDFLGEGAAVGRAAMKCRLGGMVYGFEVCADQFVVPGLLGMAMAGQDPAEAEP